MASETIINSVCEFLEKFPPFDILPSEELTKLAHETTLQYFEKDEVIIEQGQKPFLHFFVIKKGSVRVEKIQQENKILMERSDEGDLFGLRAYLAKDTYLATVTASEGTLVYQIPTAPFRELMGKYPEVTLFFASDFASDISQHSSSMSKGKESNEMSSTLRQPLTLAQSDALEINDETHEVISVSPDDKIWKAAEIMTQHNIGSLPIVDKDGKPVGIITDSDFRRKVVSSEETMKHSSVSRIMSSPVMTVDKHKSIAEMTLIMISHQISHFCVTEDGTPDSKLIGMVSQRDLVLAQGNDPSNLAKAILRTQNLDKLKVIRDKAEMLISNYLHRDVSVPYISNIITYINDLLIQKAVEITQKKLKKQGEEIPKQAFCWMSLGSEGRKEQLLRTDQDSALIFEDPPAEDLEKVKAYFLKLGEGITEVMVHCGFVRCPADMMGSNPKWCQPVSGWKSYFSEWILEPTNQNLLNTNIFFDFRPVYGEYNLAEELKSHVFAEIEKSPKFINFLAKSALENPPPLSFFRNFVVEKSGEHKDRFDIKSRAMMPLTDAARVLTYDMKINSFESTSERFKAIGSMDENLKDVADSCAISYELLMKYRARNGLRNKDSGRYTDPTALNKLERQMLRNIFGTIQKLQKILEVRYQLAFLR